MIGECCVFVYGVLQVPVVPMKDLQRYCWVPVFCYRLEVQQGFLLVWSQVHIYISYLFSAYLNNNKLYQRFILASLH